MLKFQRLQVQGVQCPELVVKRVQPLQRLAGRCLTNWNILFELQRWVKERKGGMPALVWIKGEEDGRARTQRTAWRGLLEMEGRRTVVRLEIDSRQRNGCTETSLHGFQRTEIAAQMPKGPYTWGRAGGACPHLAVRRAHT
eukprot:364394-Chlamydomonas_euryale.AAC.5